VIRTRVPSVRASLVCILRRSQKYRYKPQMYAMAARDIAIVPSDPPKPGPLRRTKELTVGITKQGIETTMIFGDLLLR